MNNTRQLFWASFLTLIAAGMGFSIRGGVLAEWGDQFGFTKSELGEIVGGGLAGFGITIIACSLFVDRVGYKPLMVLAFLPTLRYYRLSGLWALTLPVISTAYMVFTINSAVQFYRGRGGMWKGRAQAQASSSR